MARIPDSMIPLRFERWIRLLWHSGQLMIAVLPGMASPGPNHVPLEETLKAVPNWTPNPIAAKLLRKGDLTVCPPAMAASELTDTTNVHY